MGKEKHGGNGVFLFQEKKRKAGGNLKSKGDTDRSGKEGERGEV